MKNRFLPMGLALLISFGVWTVLVQRVDVACVGETGAAVGFAAVNGWFHRLTGAHLWLYYLTDWLGLVPIFVCVLFGAVGLGQLLRRRSLWKVDADLLALGVYYMLVMAAYLAFELHPINYRPILMDGRLEASYPSSTTLLTLSVMPTLALQAERRVASDIGKRAVQVLTAVFMALMVVGRAVSGVHWLSDIVGAVLLSGGLFCIYRAAVVLCDGKNH